MQTYLVKIILLTLFLKIGFALGANNPPYPTPRTSEGDFHINYRVHENIIINGFRDILLTTPKDRSTITASVALCVGREGASANNNLPYDIQATSHNGVFQLKNGQHRIAYNLFYAHNINNQTIPKGSSLHYGVKRRGLNTKVNITTCQNTTEKTSTVWVVIPKNAYNSQPDGVYKDTVVLTVAAL